MKNLCRIYLILTLLKIVLRESLTLITFKKSKRLTYNQINYSVWTNGGMEKRLKKNKWNRNLSKNPKKVIEIYNFEQSRLQRNRNPCLHHFLKSVILLGLKKRNCRNLMTKEVLKIAIVEATFIRNISSNSRSKNRFNTKLYKSRLNFRARTMLLSTFVNWFLLIMNFLTWSNSLKDFSPILPSWTWTIMSSNLCLISTWTKLNKFTWPITV